MKKLFSKNDTSQQNSLIGKVFVVGKFNVTVEDVIAEGKVQKNKTNMIAIARFRNLEIRNLNNIVEYPKFVNIQSS